MSKHQNLRPTTNGHYGSLGNALSHPKRVIYCVHGKPSAGCCKVLEGQVIDIEPVKELDIASNVKENTQAAKLCKYQKIPFNRFNQRKS